MTFQVLKSQAPADFAEQVEAYRQRLLEWRIADGVPRPTADPLVEGAVLWSSDKDNFEAVADYEIIDDTPPPPPEPTPEELKMRRITESRQQEQAELQAATPPGFRLMQMDHQRAAMIPPDKRTPAQAKVIGDFAAVNQRFADIQYAGAQREAAIEAE